MLIRFAEKNQHAIAMFNSIKRVIENPENTIVKRCDGVDMLDDVYEYYVLYAKNGMEICRIMGTDVSANGRIIMFPIEMAKVLEKLCEDLCIDVKTFEAVKRDQMINYFQKFSASNKK